MATKKEEVFLVMEGDNTVIVPDPVPTGAITYTIEEFASAAKSKFGTTPDVVYAAFRQAGIEEATKEAGTVIIKNYLTQSV